jgi:hypothetical protein
VTKITIPGSLRSGNWNENNLNPLTRINWRASLVPAAAVIPAPIAYIKVVAVKKLVVGFGGQGSGSFGTDLPVAILGWNLCGIKVGVQGMPIVYFEKIRVFKAGFAVEYISME